MINRLMKKRTKKIFGSVLDYALLTVLSLFFLLPVFIMLTRGLLSEDLLFSETTFFPKALSTEAYSKILDKNLMNWFGNTLFVVGLNMLGGVGSAFLCGYGFAKVKFKYKSFWFAVVLSTIMLPTVVMRIPLYIMFYKWGWQGTYLPLIVPAFFGGGAWNIFLVRQFVKGIPNNCLEAAKMDGANNFISLIRIIVPLSVPVIIYLSVMTFIGQWTDYAQPLLYIQNYREKWTLALAIYFKSTERGFFENHLMAFATLLTLPCIAFYAIYQKQLVEGIAITGTKA